MIELKRSLHNDVETQVYRSFVHTELINLAFVWRDAINTIFMKQPHAAANMSMIV